MKLFCKVSSMNILLLNLCTKATRMREDTESDQRMVTSGGDRTHDLRLHAECSTSELLGIPLLDHTLWGKWLFSHCFHWFVSDILIDRVSLAVNELEINDESWNSVQVSSMIILLLNLCTKAARWSYSFSICAQRPQELLVEMMAKNFTPMSQDATRIKLIYLFS